ncbi:hypothetical protein [uncultured Agrococcus sp.]|uniref:DUF7927 domain-containing protein n=1 Tax=uncultured Agrococcus sp. TaxID=382258 RepID=UPI0025CEF65E|nr:hypothetical protein [uncultured Agrococcus sp.]
MRSSSGSLAASTRKPAAAMLVFAFLVSTVAVLTSISPTPAAATTSPPNSVTVGGNTFFAYVAEGETLDVSFVKSHNHSGSGSDVQFIVTDPEGNVHMDCVISAGSGSGTLCDEEELSGPAGIWIIEEIPLTNPNQGTYARTSSSSRFTFDIGVYDAAGADLAGRVWTDIYMAYDAGGSTDYDIAFWTVNEFGAVHGVNLRGFTGGGWAIDSSAFGIVDGDSCTPIYRTTEMETNSTAYNQAGPECGDPYLIFFEEPDSGLPTSATSARGELWILPDVVGPGIENLSFTPAASDSWEGAFEFSLQNFTGAYELRIDIDGDGTFDGPRDRMVSLGGTTGQHSYEWDGLDGQGDPVDVCSPVNAEVAIDRADEVHLVLGDVEGLSGGIEVTQLQGQSPGNTVLYWDDTQVSTSGKTSTTSPLDATAGVDSEGGVHRWDNSGSNPWGNMLAIDHWAFSPVDITQSLTLAGTCLDIDKTSDADENSRIGDTVTYTVTATNTGSADFTAEDPAVVFDDLSGVLDDAEYNGDAAADRPGDVSFSSPLLAWEGALPVGESVQLTYTVTLASGGDGEVRNVAWEPRDPNVSEPPACDPADENGRDPQTGEPCAAEETLLPRLVIDKTADRTDLPAIGESVEYTVTVMNAGPGVYTEDAPASFIDDLSDVLDDAVYNDDASSDIGEVNFEEPHLSWEGALGAGESATITYTATYTGDGDKILTNLACVPEEEAAPGTDACDEVSVPGSGLSQWKEVASDDSPVKAGSVLTYTLFFENDGQAAATVDAIDDLTHVTDDADITSEPFSPDGLNVVRDGNRIQITGAVPPGETHTVTYQVTVKPDEDRGDDIAANFLLQNDPENPPIPPEDPVCQPQVGENPDCTVTTIGRLLTDKSVSADSDPVGAGTVLTYTLTFDNQGEGPVSVDHIDYLADVLDDADLTTAPEASDDALTVSEVADDRFAITGELAAGETVTVTYEVTLKEETERGNNSADNFLVPSDSGEPPAQCDADDPNCTSTPLPNVSVTKTSDPESGADVQAGDEVVYTLTFTNTGETAGDVDFTDDLTGVLDDAALTSAPVSSDPTLVPTSGEDGAIRVTGSLEAGQTVTVTYAVTVNPDGERGDNRLGNVVAKTDHPNPGCEDAGVSCTEHPAGELDEWKTADPASGTTLRPGDGVTYTLHFENIGNAPVDFARDDVLDGVLDDGDVTVQPTASSDNLDVTEIVDGRFTVTGTLEPGEIATVSYTVTIRPDGERGDDRLGNFLVHEGEEPSEECIPVDGERADCTVHHVSDVDAAKTSDPESGTEVNPGDEIEYTLTFVNRSINPDAAAVDVDYTDHMADVLDDADLVGSPVVSNGYLTATVEGDTIRITGAIPSGEVTTVTYSVTVKDYEDQGDRALANVVAITGEEPVCAPESPLCTSHEVPEPPTADLPRTGGAVPIAVIVLAMLSLAGGAALVASRRSFKAMGPDFEDATLDELL